MTDALMDWRRRLAAVQQEHVLLGFENWSNDQQQSLLAQLAMLDLGALKSLHQSRHQGTGLPAEPIRRPRLTDETAAQQWRPLGEAALRRGQVAVLMVAGGQGSRLGFEHPKGLFPIGPVTGHSLFQIHAEKVLALRRRLGRAVPFLIMTSQATHAETVDFFERNRWFGLSADEVIFFQQGTLPALDWDTGRLLLDGPGQLVLTPDGHGGTLTALARTGLLDWLRQQGVEQVFYFQVDNPLVKIADPVFLGLHLARQCEVSSKAILKRDAAEKMGVFAEWGSVCGIIEYSDLPAELATAREANGELTFGAGSPAIHIFDRAFLERITQGATQLPLHFARKKVRFYDPVTGQTVQPTQENALKLERFVFDALPLAERWVVLRTHRAEEFAPVKNAVGPDSPDSVRQALIARAADWLTRAGVCIPRTPDGQPAVPVEISPLCATEPTDLLGKALPKQIASAWVLQEPGEPLA